VAYTTGADAYSNGGGGFGLTEQDSADFVRSLAGEAAKYGMGTGLKNAQQILAKVTDVVQFAVNEECKAVTKDCAVYDDFLNEKPVFHVEYATHSGMTSIRSTYDGFKDMSSDQVKAAYCLNDVPKDTKRFSTIIKTLDLDGWVLYCDGKAAITPTES
jgi:hypothetical protein